MTTSLTSALARCLRDAANHQPASQVSHMTSPSTTLPRVVVLAAVEETDASNDVIRMASEFGRTVDGVELHYVYVMPSTASVVVEDMHLEHARSVMDKTAEAARLRFGERVIGHLATGTPWREIVQLGADLGADLIVVGSHRKSGVQRLVLGSVSEAVVRNASCPVLVARPKDRWTGVPEIEAPCPECLAIQRETAGEKLWCGQHEHKRKRVRGRVHYELPQSFGAGAMFIRPEQ